ncbi:MAG: NAD(P)H-binding protein [Steroidobacteraceae bacterium]
MIVITTPAGAIGSQVLARLLDSGTPLRVVERNPARLPARVRSRVEVVQGSHADKDVVSRAFAGAEAVFWLCPPDPRAPSLQAAYLDFTRAACAALHEHGVRRVVSVTALGRGSVLARNAGHVTASLAMDDLIAATGVHLRELAMPSFMDNLLRQVQSIKTQGVFFAPIDGDRKLPSCATRDIAAVASQLLLDEAWTGRDSVAVLGPEDLSFNDMARIMSEVLGSPVRFQQVPGDTFKVNLLRNGMSEAVAQGMLDMAMAKNHGLDNAAARDARSTTPTSFHQWCVDTLKPLIEA